MALYRLPFKKETGWQLGKGNWDDPGGGHGQGQPYAFDFGHSEGGHVRAARAGTVVESVNNVNKNTTNLPAGHPDIEKYGGGNYVQIRHEDGTVAAYAHLKLGSVSVDKNQWVPQGLDIALSGNTGQSYGPHLHFDVRSFWNSPSDLGACMLIHFEDENHDWWRPRVGQVLASNNADTRQDGWRWCGKCNCLYFGGNPGSKCPSGGQHSKNEAWNYALVHNSPNAAGQHEWRHCPKCQSLFFAGNPGSNCPAGGEHSQTGSGNYVLEHNSTAAPSYNRQEGWRWCHKCHCLFHGGVTWSKCPSGGEHSQTGSGKYTLSATGVEDFDLDWHWCKNCQGLFHGKGAGSLCPTGGEHIKTGTAFYLLIQNSLDAPGQAGWHLCAKCQGLFFGKNTVSVCPAGGMHSITGTRDYVLVQNSVNAPGQAEWRWCKNCQGLFFGGNPGSKCPAGGAHSMTGSGNYVLQ
jgi:murein DD-endopeptidase MepM/ murein hydrolase activator NlpD